MIYPWLRCRLGQAANSCQSWVLRNAAAAVLSCGTTVDTVAGMENVVYYNMLWYWRLSNAATCDKSGMAHARVVVWYGYCRKGGLG